MSHCFNWKGYGLLNPFRFYLVFLHYGHHPTLEKGRDIGGTSFLMSYAVWLFRVCSILVLRQTLLAECLVTSPSEMEDLVSKSATKLFELLDNEEDAGITEVVETMNFCQEGDDPEKHQARKEIMVNVLAKSLRAGDAVFARISRTVFLAARAILLCGTGAEGRLLAGNTLKRIGDNSTQQS